MRFDLPRRRIVDDISQITRAKAQAGIQHIESVANAIRRAPKFFIDAEVQSAIIDKDFSEAESRFYCNMPIRFPFKELWIEV